LETAVLVALLATGAFGILHSWLLEFGLNQIVTSLLFFGILVLAVQLLSLPFSIWDTFVIEEKYGFNRSTPAVFAFDFVKILLLECIIGGALIAVIIWLFYNTGSWFWIIALTVIVIFSLMANALYSKIIVPLFNKQEPLAEGPLLDAIKEFSHKAGFPVKNVFVIDGSKRSSKANAYFTGFGRNRRIVLYDTLIASMGEKEVLAVLAHEIGHYRLKHIWQSMAIGVVNSAFVLFLFALSMESARLTETLGFESAEPVFHLNLLGFSILLIPVMRIKSLLTNHISRKMEYSADAFVRRHGMAQPLVKGLKILSSQNLSNLTPHPAYVCAYYSHPPLHDRVKKLTE
ncbi:MAG TPA: M48 family metallopeptidase, partial [Acidobacteriota bacterium]|nr:M48 family metallopeptidase [Acidobacteriota bacterium]